MTPPEPTPIVQIPEPRNLVDRVARRRDAAIAGHAADVPTIRTFLVDPDASVRATALGALARADALATTDVTAAAADPAPEVRRRVAEVVAATTIDFDTAPVLLGLLFDDADAVVETASWAAGEWLGREGVVPGAVNESVLDRLIILTTTHPDALCREAAVAALGAIGDERALPAILSATTDKATVRRRAVIALAPFEGDDVDAALARARRDRDWQVRQAAEDQGEPAEPDDPDVARGPDPDDHIGDDPGDDASSRV